MNVIQTSGLTRKFGETTAVDNVSIHVRQGEIYGFLGLNGAGKTTLIRLLLGMIKPDDGSVSLFGNHAKRGTSIWNDVGYLVETSYSYPDLSVRENLEVIARLRRLKDTGQIDRIIQILQLKAYEHKKAKHLSMGNNQRLGLAKALIHQPRLLILDEPINGLDPSGIVEIREFLKDLVSKHNTTIFISSHILSEISKLATRIGIVHQGKLIKEINSSDLESQIVRKLHVKTSDDAAAVKALKNNGFEASLCSGLIALTDTISIQNPERIAEVLVNSGYPPKMLTVFEEDLEAYFLRIIGN